MFDVGLEGVGNVWVGCWGYIGRIWFMVGVLGGFSMLVWGWGVCVWLVDWVCWGG